MKTNRATIIGIDPGVQTGVAIYIRGKLSELQTIAPHEIGELLDDVSPGLVIFEDSRLQSHVWTAAGTSRNAAIKIGRNVGQIDQQCIIIEALCDKRGISCVGISPLKKGAKLSAEAFKIVTGWGRRTNQHERDAAMLRYCVVTDQIFEG